MGRNAQPIDILTVKGKKHLTKAEKEERKRSEIKLGDEKITCPMFVIHDTIAYKKWRDLIADYNAAKKNGIEIIKSSDAGILARYCKTYSEYLELLERKGRINKISDDSDGLENYIDNSEQFNCRIKKRLMDMISTDAILRIDTAINKKMDMLIKMEDRLFLNPLAKIKNVPKKEEPKTDPLGDKGFGNV